MFRVPKSQLESMERIEDKVVLGRHGLINIRLFSPKNEGPLPVIIYFHGGGWVYGSIEQSEMICRKLANETGAIVAAIEYRLSPEHNSLFHWRTVTMPLSGLSRMLPPF